MDSLLGLLQVLYNTCRLKTSPCHTYLPSNFFVYIPTQLYGRVVPRPRIYRPCTPDFFALLFMLYSTAAYVSYKFEREIQIQSNDLNSLAASIPGTGGRTSFDRLTVLSRLSRLVLNKRAHFFFLIRDEQNENGPISLKSRETRSF